MGDLLEVKLQAITNMYEAHVEFVLVTCIINGINNLQVACIVQLELYNPQEGQLPLLPGGQLLASVRASATGDCFPGNSAVAACSDVFCTSLRFNPSL
jgi:hypothetical protein